MIPCLKRQHKLCFHFKLCIIIVPRMESRDIIDEEYYTNCRICFQLFDIDESKPLLLQCTHTFCFKCLKELHNENLVQCPLCRSPTTVEDISTLPRNIYVEHIVYMHHHRQIEKDLGLLQWCFSCKEAGSSLCLKNDHAVFNMSTYAEKLNSEIAISSFGEAIESWKTINKDLKTVFRTKPSYSEEVFQLMDNVENKIELLSTQMKSFEFDSKQNDKKNLKIQSHFQRTNDVLVKSKRHLKDIRKRIEEIRQEPTGTQDDCKYHDSHKKNVDIMILQTNEKMSTGVQYNSNLFEETSKTTLKMPKSKDKNSDL